MLDLATAFPRPVWLDHLLPRLKLREVVTLRATCKDIRAIVADMRPYLGERPVKDLKAMLTCFPKAEEIILDEGDSMTEAEQDSLLAWLEERGNSLTSIQYDSPEQFLGPFLTRAWRAGVFKTVENVSLGLDEEDERDLLIDGVVSGVERTSVRLSDEASEAERAALASLRQFPVLKSITIAMGATDAALSPFIPPSLDELSLDSQACIQPALLLGCLPPMIESSGAKLRYLFLFAYQLDDGGTALGVRSLLQACASTLKELTLHAYNSYASAVEVAEGLASCQHLEHLEAPISTFAMMPPDGSTIFRVDRLRFSDCLGYGRALSSLALWGLMARGGFPTLSSLSLDIPGWEWDEELGPAMVAAFEGVAGTLKDLTILQFDFDNVVDADEADGVLQQLGEAIGKLRQLETLRLYISNQGTAYHHVAQGMAKGACPALHTLII
jgi:hypothetical protein